MLAALEAATWPANLRMGEAAIRSRVTLFASGQRVIDRFGKVAAAIFTQRIRNVAVLNDVRFEDVLSLHDDAGSVWQLVTVQADPECGVTLGDELAYAIT
jgi:hypothetical protein